MNSLSTSTVKNTRFENLNLESNGGRNASLFRYAENSVFSNITISTSSPAISNSISIHNQTNIHDVGALISWAQNCSFSDITIENTIVKAYNVTFRTSTLGGMAGKLIQSNLTRCFNLGFKNDISTIIVDSPLYTGGLVGASSLSYISSCGVENGIVFSSTNITGGVVGYLSDTQVDQVYIKSASVQSNSSVLGSLFGVVEVLGKNVEIKNAYSRANSSGIEYVVRIKNNFQ